MSISQWYYVSANYFVVWFLCLNFVSQICFTEKKGNFFIEDFQERTKSGGLFHCENRNALENIVLARRNGQKITI